MIQYPAIFKLAGQDELIYIVDSSHLNAEIQLQKAYFTPDDVLIDSTGQAYALHLNHKDISFVAAPVKHYKLVELTTLVQAHFFALAQSCVVKIQAPSIAALLQLLADSD